VAAAGGTKARAWDNVPARRTNKVVATAVAEAAAAGDAIISISYNFYKLFY